jgi:hypothetical protein
VTPGLASWEAGRTNFLDVWLFPAGKMHEGGCPHQTAKNIFFSRRKTMTQRFQNAGFVLVAALMFGACVCLPTPAGAAKPVVEIEGVGYNVNVSMADNLKLFVGKKVYLRVDSGAVMGGIVKEVGDHFVHLEKLDGKEYFDALIRIDAIRAMDARFRQ